MKFTASVAGEVTGVRFYKQTWMGGYPHVGHLWSSTGTLLATATFTNETSSGWQQVSFSSPVAIQANTVYIVSFSTGGGYFGITTNFFTSGGVTNGPLQALSNSVSGGDGVYNGAGDFPDVDGNGMNFWVDVAFTPSSSGSDAAKASSPAAKSSAPGGFGISALTPVNPVACSHRHRRRRQWGRHATSSHRAGRHPSYWAHCRIAARSRRSGHWRLCSRSRPWPGARTDWSGQSARPLTGGKLRPAPDNATRRHLFGGRRARRMGPWGNVSDGVITAAPRSVIRGKTIRWVDSRIFSTWCWRLCAVRRMIALRCGRGRSPVFLLIQSWAAAPFLSPGWCGVRGGLPPGECARRPAMERMRKLKTGTVVESPATGKRFLIANRLGEGGYGCAYRVQRLDSWDRRIQNYCLKTTTDPESWHREAYFGELLNRCERAIRVYDSFPLFPPTRRLWSAVLPGLRVCGAWRRSETISLRPSGLVAGPCPSGNRGAC